MLIDYKVKQNMEIERSRNGFYTVTFINKNNIDEQEIRKEFSTVGNVCSVIKNFQRIFIRFKEKEEAERALKKFGKTLDLNMASNRSSDTTTEGTNTFPNAPRSHLPSNFPISDSSTMTADKANSGNNTFHLILGNLPKNYTIKDVNALVEEAKPICINQMDETRVFNLKFCHIVVDSYENLKYLINKLDGFVICGEKLIATEVKNLLEWSKKSV